MNPGASIHCTGVLSILQHCGQPVLPSRRAMYVFPDHFHQLHDMCRVKSAIPPSCPDKRRFLDGCDGEWGGIAWHRCNPEPLIPASWPKRSILASVFFDDGFNHQVCPAAVDIRRDDHGVDYTLLIILADLTFSARLSGVLPDHYGSTVKVADWVSSWPINWLRGPRAIPLPMVPAPTTQMVLIIGAK